VADIKDKSDSTLDEGSVSFLTGKMVPNDIASEDGAFVIKRGTVLTKELIYEAEKNDMLVQLTMAV
jgi:hypothetical protein